MKNSKELNFERAIRLLGKAVRERDALLTAMKRITTTCGNQSTPAVKVNDVWRIANFAVSTAEKEAAE